MIIAGSRVRHRNEEINALRGIMTVVTIKNGHAFCAYMDFERLGTGQWTYMLKDLKLATD